MKGVFNPKALVLTREIALPILGVRKVGEAVFEVS